MTTLREVAQQALEALETYERDGKYLDVCRPAIRALRAALAQQEQDTDCHAQGICQRSGYGIGDITPAELSAALGWPGGIGTPVLDKGELLRMVASTRVAQQEQATVKESLQVDPKGGMQIATPLPLTTTDLAWLETRRLVRVWKELGQMRWTGADEGWDRAIEAVRARLDKECQDVLAWKEKVEASGQTAAQLLQKLRGMKDE